MNNTAIIDRILADPPAVHAMDRTDNPEIGVWSTDRDCYEFIASQVHAGSRTLETGSGVSTVLFTLLGTDHVAVTPSQDEADRFAGYCRERDIDRSKTAFEIGGSDDVLPRLTRPLDLVLVDGGHGFPTPILDWYYGGGRLVRGGIIVFDDMQLPQVASMAAQLRDDPRWTHITTTVKWSAWRRNDEGTLGQDWVGQNWFRGWVKPTPAEVPARIFNRVKRMVKR